MEHDAPPYGRLLAGIRGLSRTVVESRAKFKYGGNKPPEKRAEIARRLQERDRGHDTAAREHLLRRSGTAEAPSADAPAYPSA